MGVPYCIVKNKARLGRVARRKTTSCLAITQVIIDPVFRKLIKPDICFPYDAYYLDMYELMIFKAY